MELFYPLIVLAVLGALMGIMLSLAGIYLAVKEDPRIDVIEKLLPGYNCGACGVPGCRAFATGIVKGEVEKLSRCRPGKPDKNYNPILEYLKDNPNPDGSATKAKI